MQKYNPGSACAECSTQEKHKGQTISEGNFDAIISSKYERKYFKDFCPCLKMGQIKKMKALIR